MRNNRTKSAVITATLAANSPAASLFYEINVTQELCHEACADETPVFAPAFSVVDFGSIGTGQYIVTIHVEGVISYAPCRCGSCQTRTQIVSQDFTLPIYSAAELSSVTLTTGRVTNAIERNCCKDCSRVFVSETALTLALA